MDQKTTRAIPSSKRIVSDHAVTPTSSDRWKNSGRTIFQLGGDGVRYTIKAQDPSFEDVVHTVVNGPILVGGYEPDTFNDGDGYLTIEADASTGKVFALET